MHKADDVAPGIAMFDGRDGTLPGQRPDPTQDGLQTNPMFVDRPQLDGCLWKCRRHLPQQRAQALLEVGLCLRVGLHMTRTGHSQPCTKTSQVGPAELTTDASTESLADPGGNRPP